MVILFHHNKKTLVEPLFCFLVRSVCLMQKKCENAMWSLLACALMTADTIKT